MARLAARCGAPNNDGSVNQSSQSWKVCTRAVPIIPAHPSLCSYHETPVYNPRSTSSPFPAHPRYLTIWIAVSNNGKRFLLCFRRSTPSWRQSIFLVRMCIPFGLLHAISFRSAHLFERFTAVGLMCALWDHIITLDEEVDLIWSKRIDITKLAFFFYRYGTEAGLLYVNYSTLSIRSTIIY